MRLIARMVNPIDAQVRSDQQGSVTDHVTVDEAQATGDSRLRLEVAGFAAVQAVVLAVIAETDVVPALAENAEAVTLAAFFFLVALRADEGHAPRVARFVAGLK